MAGRFLSGEQLHRLLASQLSLAGASAWNAAPLLRLDVEHILGEPAVVLIWSRGKWIVEARSSPSTDLDQVVSLDVLRLMGRSFSADVTLGHASDGSAWTVTRLTPSPSALLAVRGDWISSSATFRLWAAALATARRESLRVRASRLQSLTHRLAVRLTQANNIHEVCDEALKAMAASVNARLAALAVPSAHDQTLSVVATHGYPLDLVKHLRIQPGEGVIGSVYATGRALAANSASEFANRKPRPRYRSDSFVAIPIRVGKTVIGVVCATDRFDGTPFSRKDASTLRALAAPTALAIGREVALVQMREFAHGAAIDPVSGSFNRRHFQARLEEELQRSRRDGLTLALLMIDVDDFKRVNDSFGHLVGDLVIKDVADILRRSVRVFDVCARFGGEEFAVLMPASTLRSASSVADRIRERIEAYRRAERGLESLKITASVGLAVSAPDVSARELVEKTDEALYRAKGAGKNRVCVSPAEPEAVSRLV